MRWISFFSLLALLLACSKSKDAKTSLPLNPHETSQVFFKGAQQLTVQIAYETGAEPYVDDPGVGPLSGMPLFWFLEENITALFLGRDNPPAITVPKTLAEMKELPAQSKALWTPDAIMKLAQAHRGTSTPTQTYFWIVFLRGHYSTDGTNPQSQTVGVSIQGTTVIAVFKDVVEASGFGHAGVIPKFVEQSTLVHEMGHALGLVNMGLPMVEAHEDGGHAGHCDNSDCVMYWQNEATADLVQFAIKVSTSGTPVLYGAKCLKDSREF